MNICCVDGCTKPSRNKYKPGTCWGHYKRFLRHGDVTLGFRAQRPLQGKLLLRDLTDTKKAYWAGFFDGEGSLGIYDLNRPHALFRTTISQKEPFTENLEEIAALYDGSIYRNTTTHMCCLQLSSLRAYEFLLDIYPHTVIKRQQIKVFLDTVDAIRADHNPDEAQAGREITRLKKEKE